MTNVPPVSGYPTCSSPLDREERREETGRFALTTADREHPLVPLSHRRGPGPDRRSGWTLSPRRRKDSPTDVLQSAVT